MLNFGFGNNQQNNINSLIFPMFMRWFLNVMLLPDGESITVWGNLFQSYTTLQLNKFFLSIVWLRWTNIFLKRPRSLYPQSAGWNNTVGSNASLPVIN